MKLIVVLLFAGLMQVSAAGFAQKVTLQKKNMLLKEALRQIRLQSGFNILYDADLLNKTARINVNLKNATVEDALKVVLDDQKISFTIKEKTVILEEKESSLIDRIITRFQQINVSGRVVDTDGRALPGASVSVKGKGRKAVSTGADGNFYLKGVDEDAVLLISFIGYVPKEVKAVKELGDVVLELSNSKLDEVQVIAYGTTTQRLSTGNVTTIKADVIEKQPVNNPLLALQGRVPGLFIEQGNGLAGSAVKVRIQGQNSRECNVNCVIQN